MVASVEVSAVVGNRLGGWENERRDGTAAHLAAGRRAAGLPEPLALPNFLRLFPHVFHLRAPLPLSLSLTPTVVDLSAELTRRVEGRQRGQGEGRRRGG